MELRKDLLELREDVLDLMSTNNISFTSIYKDCGVSNPTVIKLIDYTDTHEEINKKSRVKLTEYINNVKSK